MDRSLKIRPAIREDAGRIAELEENIFSDAWSKEDYEKLLEGQAVKFYVAEVGDDIAGYGGYTVAADEADIIDIGIAKESQRKGIGSRLLACMLGNLSGKRVFLEVRESNTPAIRLYEKFGFKDIGVRKNYYDNPKENAIIMFTERKEL